MPVRVRACHQLPSFASPSWLYEIRKPILQEGKVAWDAGEGRQAA